MKKIVSILIAAFAFLFACKRETSTELDSNGKNVSNINEMSVPNGFHYETTKEVELALTLKTNNDMPSYNTIVKLSTNSTENNGSLILKGMTDKNGVFKAKVTIPSSLDQIIINTSAFNISDNVVVDVTANKNVSLVLGGSNPAPVKTIPRTATKTKGFGKSNAKFSSKLGTWSLPDGLPSYIATPNDVVDVPFQNRVGSMYPESINHAATFPRLVNDNYSSRILIINQQTDVYITFLNEGAGLTNTLFYYTYDKDFPPLTEADIDSFYIVYPNVSKVGDGGSLLTGMRVNIGNFPAGTAIGFGIASGGFVGTNNIDPLTPKYFSTKSLNPEVNADKQHVSMVLDPSTDRFIFGFEDLNRDWNPDNDFNDVMFYGSSSVINAISKEKVYKIASNTDTDGDGVDDGNDDYPTDPDRAFDNYYPNGGFYGSVAFEDNWPYKGDYDLNDLVVEFRHNAVTNASNNVVEVKSNVVTRASGAAFTHAFHVEFPVPNSNSFAVTGGTKVPAATNTVIQYFNDSRSHFSSWNTWPGVAYSDSTMFTSSFQLTTPIDISTFGISEYNPFIYVNDVDHGTTMEVHLPGKKPTNIANTGLFGQGIDDSNVGLNKFYLSTTNLPWAISTPVPFQYPSEKVDITEAYLNFAAWAQSGGASNRDWYTTKVGNRDNAKIYVRP
ncbi:MAG: LruC domain-containing protein [Bacteroidota bacterium]